jgi:hypothetical protein
MFSIILFSHPCGAPIRALLQGFWEAKPSLLTASGTGFYFAGNLHAEIKSMRSGTFFVYGVDGDYLTFEEDNNL